MWYDLQIEELGEAFYPQDSMKEARPLSAFMTQNRPLSENVTEARPLSHWQRRRDL